MSQENIHTEFHRMLNKEDKESLLNQRGKVIWLYGLSGSGKSTLANALERKLYAEKKVTTLLDGDNIRSGLNNNLGFTDEDRLENIRRIAEVAKLFSQNGIITITSFICPKNDLRALARSIIGEDNIIEVYVRASWETCAKRDVKGLYAKAQAGEIKNFTGKDSNFEEPDQEPDLTIDTEHESLEDSLATLYTTVNQTISK